MNAGRARICVFLFAVEVLLTACSGITPYRNDLEKNLRIESKTRSGSIFQTLNAGVHIYHVDTKCRIDYQGTIKLDDSPISAGLAVNRPLFLEFYFAKSAIFVNKSSSTTYGLLLRPLPAHDYTAEVSYLDDLYKVRIWEKKRGGESRRPVERKPLETCVPQ